MPFLLVYISIVSHGTVHTGKVTVSSTNNEASGDIECTDRKDDGGDVDACCNTTRKLMSFTEQTWFCGAFFFGYTIGRTKTVNNCSWICCPAPELYTVEQGLNPRGNQGCNQCNQIVSDLVTATRPWPLPSWMTSSAEWICASGVWLQEDVLQNHSKYQQLKKHRYQSETVRCRVETYEPRSFLIAMICIHTDDSSKMQIANQSASTLEQESGTSMQSQWTKGRTSRVVHKEG